MESLIVLKEIVENVVYELRVLGKRVEADFHYHIINSPSFGENKETLINNFRRYCDGIELCEIFLSGQLHLGELLDELERLNLHRFVVRLISFKPDNCFKHITNARLQ